MSDLLRVEERGTAPAGRRTGRLASALIYAVLIGYAVTTVYPFVWLVGSSFKGPAEFHDALRVVPHHPTWDNFHKAFTLVPLGRFFLNSLFVSVVVTVGTVTTSALAGYAFARLRWRGRDTVFLAYLATMMVPWSVVMIPTFVLMKTLGWIDTYYALTVPAMFSAYGTFMLRQFFLGIAREYEDAAKIDGCGFVGVFRHVILPLSKPALATLALFTFLGTWNDLIMPLIFIFREQRMTVTVGLDQFNGMYDTDWGARLAGALVVLLPMLVLFGVGQRYFTRGIRLSVDKS